MSIIQVATADEANAIPDPKFIVWRKRAGYIVATGADIPVEDASGIVVSLWAFKEALRALPGNMLTDAETAVASFSARRKLLWETTSEIGRSWSITTAIRNNTTLNNSDMDNVFRSASILSASDI